MSQLPFRWPADTSYDADDFVISESNARAAQFLGDWPGPGAALLVGPAASGKTHLARGWGVRVQAGAIDKAALGTASSDALWRTHRACVLEDIHESVDDTALFHLIRHTESHRLCLLLTSRVPATELAQGLPDLRSRLLALPGAVIHSPDEAALRAFLLKCFADRQWRVKPEVVEYMLRRMERSFSAAHALVERIEQRAQENNRDIAIPLVRTCLVLKEDKR